MRLVSQRPGARLSRSSRALRFRPVLNSPLVVDVFGQPDRKVFGKSFEGCGALRRAAHAVDEFAWMKRLSWAVLAGLILHGSARPCMPPPPHLNFSPNGRYFVASGYYGTSFWDQKRQVWHHPLERGSAAAVSDRGDLIVCRIGTDWTLYNSKGKQIATVENAPLEFDLDPPRTCWSSHGFYYLELSQGDIFVLSHNHWQREAKPDGVPAEVRHHQRTPVSDSDLETFISDQKYRWYLDRSCPNFRNLSNIQVEHLLERLRQGNSRAGLALGLARCEKARADLLRYAFSPNSDPGEDCQQAILLLDGQKAAVELIPALKGWTSWHLLRLYERIYCPQAIPLLLTHLSHHQNDSSHAALVAQTRVDLGYRAVDWEDWLAKRDRSRLSQFGEPSAPLWLAQQEQSALGDSLTKLPKLVGRFDLGGEGTNEVALRGERLIRREGDAHNRVLEWSLKDGKPLVTIPSGVPLNAIFCWNSTRQLFYYESSNCAGLWHGQATVFTEEFCGNTGIYTSSGKGSSRGKRPTWLPRRLSDVHFTPDDSSVEGFFDGQTHRYSLSDSSHQIPHEEDSGLKSPDGRYWLGGSPLQLMNMKEGLLYRSAEALRAPCFSPDSRLLAAVMDGEIGLFQAKDLRLIRRFRAPDGCVEQLAFDDRGRRLAIVTADSASLYELNPDPPDLGCDTRLLAECWTGQRLWAGGARKVTEVEYWQRRRRLAESFSVAPSPYVPITAGLFGVVLLSVAYFLLTRDGRQTEQNLFCKVKAQ